MDSLTVTVQMFDGHCARVCIYLTMCCYLTYFEIALLVSYVLLLLLNNLKKKVFFQAVSYSFVIDPLAPPPVSQAASPAPNLHYQVQKIQASPHHRNKIYMPYIIYALYMPCFKCLFCYHGGDFPLASDIFLSPNHIS